MPLYGKSRPRVSGSPSPSGALADDDPRTAAIVAVPAARLAPAIPLTTLPPPVVRMDAQAKVWAIVWPTTHAPAIAFIITDDGRRCRRGGQGQRGCANKQGLVDRSHM